MHFLSRRFFHNRAAIGFLVFLVACTVLMGACIAPTRADAAAGVPAITTEDFPAKMKEVNESIQSKIEDIGDKFVTQAFRRIIVNSVARLGTVVGKSLATGGKGGKSMLDLRDPNSALSQVGDAALGDVMDAVGEGIGFSLCLPPDIRFNIAIAMFNGVEPPAPKCTFSQMKDNYTNFYTDLQNTTLEDVFSVSGSGVQTDAQTAISAFIAAENNKERARDAERLRKQMSQFMNAAGMTFSGVANAPLSIVEEVARLGVPEKTDPSPNVTGQFWADTFSIGFYNLVAAFTETKIQSLLEGFRTVPEPSTLTRPDRSRSPSLSGPTANIATVAVNFRQTGTEFDLLTELSQCPDVGRTPYSCVLDQNFGEAIRQKLSVQEAMTQGLLRGDFPFGFTGAAVDQEPRFDEGYGLTNLRKLRRARIIPVGWEFAAEAVRNGTPSGNPPVNQPMRGVTLQRVVSEFNTPTSPFYHLVDPQWILSAPLMRCDLEAPGELHTPNTEDRLEYCVDMKDCVVPNEDGSGCKSWGYCTREQNIWRFDGESCDKNFNSCRTFTRTVDGVALSLLANTIDGRSCTPSVAGCRWYSTAQAATTFSAPNLRAALSRAGLATTIVDGLSATAVSNIHDALSPLSTFDATVVRRALTDAGINAEVVTALAAPALRIIQGAGRTWSAGDTTKRFFSRQVGECDPKDVGCRAFIELIDRSTGQQLSPAQYQTLVDPRGDPAVSMTNPNSSRAYVTSATIEVRPLHLNGNRIDCRGAAETAPLADQARNVGCTLYTPEGGDPAVPAVVRSEDSCPASCVGYHVFRELATEFSQARDPLYFIPSTAASCSAETVGCEEFTNLDTVQRGGEEREYYTKLRHCQVPTEPDTKTFFTWTGTATTGFQLQVHQLKETQASRRQSGQTAPCVKRQLRDNTCIDDDATINAMRQVCDATKLQTNADCREFYDAQGNVSYRLFSKTIAADAACSRYRRTIVNPTDPFEATNCTTTGGKWDAPECTYLALGKVSTQCSVAGVGCRAYKGTTANNVRIVYEENFEGDVNTVTTRIATTLPPRQPGVPLGVPSSVSVSSGGRSFEVPQGNADLVLPQGAISAGMRMTLEFWALASGNITIRMHQAGQQNIVPSQSVAATAGLWRQYVVGPFDIPATATAPTTTITFEHTGRIYLDNIRIKESGDQFFLLKETWLTPSACTVNPQGANDPAFMVGCRAYTNTNNTAVHLRQFSQLCEERFVGCEAMIDTQNSTSPLLQAFQGGTTIPTSTVVTTPAPAVPATPATPQLTVAETIIPTETFGVPASASAPSSGTVLATLLNENFQARTTIPAGWNAFSGRIVTSGLLGNFLQLSRSSTGISLLASAPLTQGASVQIGQQYRLTFKARTIPGASGQLTAKLGFSSGSFEPAASLTDQFEEFTSFFTPTASNFVPATQGLPLTFNINVTGDALVVNIDDIRIDQVGNGSAATSALPAGWTAQSGTGVTAQIVTDPQQGNVLRVALQPNFLAQVRALNIAVPSASVQTGQRYRLTLKARAPQGAATLSIGFANGGGQFFSPLPVLSSQFQSFIIELPSAATSAIPPLSMVVFGSTSAVDIDDVLLERLAVATTTTTIAPPSVPASSLPSAPDVVIVPADTLAYIVNDPNNACGAQAKGCSLLGTPSSYLATTAFPGDGSPTGGDVRYLNDNPDKYGESLCTVPNLGCEAWTTSKNGSAYFKDPETRLCDWKAIPGVNPAQFAWFQRGSTSLTSDCGAKTTDGSTVPATFARTCSALQDWCTEFRDPNDPVNPDVSTPPRAGFRVDTARQYTIFPITFTSTATGGVTSTSWNFGAQEGTASGSPVVSHVYSQPGTYTVTQTVRGPAGEESATHTVRIEASQTATSGSTVVTYANPVNIRSINFNSEIIGPREVPRYIATTVSNGDLSGFLPTTGPDGTPALRVLPVSGRTPTQFQVSIPDGTIVAGATYRVTMQLRGPDSGQSVLNNLWFSNTISGGYFTIQEPTRFTGRSSAQPITAQWEPFTFIHTVPRQCTSSQDTNCRNFGQAGEVLYIVGTGELRVDDIVIERVTRNQNTTSGTGASTAQTVCSATESCTATSVAGSRTIISIPVDGRPYYFLDTDDLEKKRTECNSAVSLKEGCVLFKNTSMRNASGDVIARYNSKATYQRSEQGFDGRQPNTAVPAVTCAGGDPAPCTAPAGSTLDANEIIKVRRDRTCGEWLSCVSSERVFNAETQQTSTVCNAIAPCTGVESGNASACGSFPPKDVPDRCVGTRDGTDADLIGDSDGMECRFTSDYAFCAAQGGSCTPRCISTGFTNGKFCVTNPSNANEVTRTQCTNDGGRCNDPLPQALEVATYTKRNLAWSGLDYSGYALPHHFALQHLEQRSERIDDKGRPINLRLTYFAKLTDALGRVVSCTSPSDCQAGNAGATVECRRFGRVSTTPGTCYIERGVGLQGTQTIAAVQKSCRAYPASDAPFPDSVVTAWEEPKETLDVPEDQDTPPRQNDPNAFNFKEVPITKRILNEPKQRKTGFERVNVEQRDQDAECTYRRARYSDGSLRFWSIDGPMTSRIGVSPQAPELRTVQAEHGVRGYCLEEDPFLTKNGERSQHPCMTWYPVDLLRGEVNGGTLAPEAGYQAPDNKFYCVETEKQEYRETFTIKINRGCAAIARGSSQSCTRNSQNYRERRRTNCVGGFHGSTGMTITCKPFTNGVFTSNGWYPYDGFQEFESAHEPNTRIICKKMALIAEGTGDTVAWTDRLKGSTVPGYAVSINRPAGVESIDRASLTAPFAAIPGLDDPITAREANPIVVPGALVIPDNVAASYAYDNRTGGARNQPPIPRGTAYNDANPSAPRFEPATEQSGVNVIYGIERLRQLFARGFGLWSYESSNSDESPTTAQCTGGVFGVNNLYRECTTVTAGESDECRICVAGDTNCAQDLASVRCAPSTASGKACAGGSNRGRECANANECPIVDPETEAATCVPAPSKYCTEGARLGLSCTVDSECGRYDLADPDPDPLNDTICISGVGKSICNQGVNAVKECLTATDCRSAECQQVTAPKYCTGGPRFGQLCGSDPECSGSGRCDAPARPSSPVNPHQFNFVPGVTWNFASPEKNRANIPDPNDLSSPMDTPIGHGPEVRAVRIARDGSFAQSEGNRGVTVENQESGDVPLPYSSAGVTVKFYAYNENGNQLPLRTVTIDWRDGQDEGIQSFPGAKKNHKAQCNRFCTWSVDDNHRPITGIRPQSCSTNESCGETPFVCRDGENHGNPCEGIGINRACLRRDPENALGRDGVCVANSCFVKNWGDNVDACLQDEANGQSGYFAYTYRYSCKRDDLDRLKNAGLACGAPGVTSPCWTTVDGFDSCVFIPRVQVIDNWGWCNGDCPGTASQPRGSVVTEASPGTKPRGCYNYPPGDGPQECNVSDRAWTPFAGRIIMRPTQ